MTKIFTILIILLFRVSTFGQTKSKGLKDSCAIFVQNALTPNGSDKLNVEIKCDINSFDFKLYDRWGKLVYSTNKLTIPLDLNIYDKTKIKGKEVPKYTSGTYFWIAKYQLKDLVEKSSTGTLALFTNP